MFLKALLIIAEHWKKHKSLWMEKETLVHSFNSILLNNIKEQTTETYNTDETMRNTKWKKSKRYLHCDSTDNDIW